MTLTEEQLAALKRVVAYMDEMYAVASPYHGCTEDSDLLRAMIDSSDHIVEPDELIGFDLEKVKADLCDIGDPRFCDCEVRTQLAAAIAEIERLRAELEEAQESLTEAYLLGSHEKAQEMAARIKALERGSINQAAKIRELEAEIERLAQPNASDDWGNLIVLSVSGGEYRDVAPHQLTEEGKIGPDARPPCWQITEDQARSIQLALNASSTLDHRARSVLRAMLEEDTHGKP